MSGGGGGGQTQTVQKSDPWYGVQENLKDLYSQASDWQHSRQPKYYPDSTVAPVAPETTLAQSLTTQRALSGSPVLNAAQNYGLNTLQGNWLSPSTNPYLDMTFQAGAQPLVNAYRTATAPSIMSQFEAGGRYGSNSEGQALANGAVPLTQGLSQLASSVYGGNYENERARQQQEQMFAPDLANADYNDLSKLAAIGESKQGNAQAILNDLVNRWNFNQNQPLNGLEAYSRLLQGGNQFGTQSGSSNSSQNGSLSQDLSTGLGAAATGYGLYSLFSSLGSAGSAALLV